ncbi:Transposon Tf2-11 polyprotein, partial [Smittium culicis]
MEPSARGNPKTTKESKMPDSKEKVSTLPKIFPGTSGAPVFSGEGLAEFLTFYDIITTNSSSKEKTQLFPYYCDKDIRDKIIKSIPYSEGNWLEFKALLNDYYEVDECEKVLADELNILVQKGTSLHDIKIFLHTFEYLVKKLDKYTTTSDREKKEMLIKSIHPSDFFKIQSSIYDNEGALLSFDEMVKKLKSLNTIHRTLDEIRGNNAIETPKIETAKDEKDLDTMTKMFEKMCLKMDAFIEAVPNNKNIPEKYEPFKRKIRCVYCDEEHRRIDCTIFQRDKESGIVRLSADGFIEDNNGKRMTPNWGKGGIHALIPKHQAKSRQIKFENSDESDYALEWESDFSTKEIDKKKFSYLVNSFASKRTRDNDNYIYTSNKKERAKINPKADSNTMKNINPITNKSTNIDDIPLKDRILEAKEFSEEFNPAYKMLSKIVNKDSENTITDKIKNTEVSISLKELFSVSPIVRKKFSEELRVRREPNVSKTFIEDLNSKSYNSDKNTNFRNIDGNWNDFYLAAGSGTARGYIMGAEVEFLLDEGSEINIMNVDVYNALHSLKRIKIDENIKWSIRDANQGLSELNGVCKNCLISICGIEISVPVFVSNSTEPQVILGRPWERKARAMKDNRDDGTLWYTIKDPETGAAATFCAVGLQDKRSFPQTNSKNTAFTLVNRIQAGWTAISKTNYITEVNTRYKNVKSKIKPVPHTLPSYSSKPPEKLITNKIRKPLTSERLSELFIGDGNLTDLEVDYFKERLKPLGEVFAFSEEEIDENLTNEGIGIYVHKHIDDVVEILTTLKATGMTINAKKCRFGLAKVEVVGFICSEEGRKPTESKINKILQWPRPRNIKELRGFLGLTCFYRVWIKSYSVLADPLYKLLRKDEVYIWNKNQEKSFNTLKALVSTAPILKAPNYTKNPGKFILTVDASPVGAGGVLQQEDEKGDRKPCRFESYCFSARERRYSQIKRELFAMMKIIKKLRMYLYGVHFLLETDCRPLIGLLNKPDLPNDAASRWIGYILQFDFEISHIKGAENCVADAISRYSFPENDTEVLRINTDLVDHSEFSKVEQVKKILANPENVTNIRPEVKNVLKNYFTFNGNLFKRSVSDRIPRRVITDPDHKSKIIKQLHEMEGGGHRGRDATRRKISDRYYWENLSKDVEIFVKNCFECQVYSKVRHEEPLFYTHTSTLFGKFGIDLVLMPAGIGKKKYLIVA